ncbi:3-deoxy-D-manno-octulosonic acid transferase [Coraliomargarita sp. SDUM461004]|uniref:3-deoxy-D-manno-octulosonic acid transferase n=1 Tax=Thalassobacterium sedimentorum TaxID=3041258 RepID=A0ABU1AIL9_9BACT|nr:3-deoxy-D-manno-octulosonic acid transferase [Coraliomargarita sp. SDUM461004]MDQ8194542.1 3-deoxy-D-manno-octulosonic acid transferase [Coraliomargarita sp. SDUM461004]
MIWFYRLLYLPGLLIALPYYILRMWRRGGYAKSFQHRFGRFYRLAPVETGKQRIWLQAVSVGEVLAIGPLLKALQQEPNIEIVLTTTTSTGYAEARKRYADLVLRVGIFPLDFWLFNRTAWERIQPTGVILTESELWPEHLHQAQKRKVPAYLVNARISDTSFRRYQKVPLLAHRMLRKFNASYAASELDRSRLLQLGSPQERLLSFGSIKFDVAIGERFSEIERSKLQQDLGFGNSEKTPFVLLGSSTWPGEEAILLEAQRVAIANGIDCRLLLVPRHAERATEIIAILKAQNFSWYQRSTGHSPPSNLRIHLADTTGELTRLSQAADLAFIGKSLASNEGGQTPIEAAGLGVPILMGPNMNNFKDIAQSLVRAGAAQRIAHAQELIERILQLAQDEHSRLDMQEAALKWHQNNRGSSQRISQHLLTDLKGEFSLRT